MTKSEELASSIVGMMQVMANEDQWPIPFELVKRMVDQTISGWVDEVESEIQTLIKDWEVKMENDDSLYSLGLRRALDVVKGQSSIS
jgi:hypothetical protein